MSRPLLGATFGMDNAFRGYYPEALYGPASLMMEGSLRSFTVLIARAGRAETQFNDRYTQFNDRYHANNSQDF